MLYESDLARIHVEGYGFHWEWPQRKGHSQTELPSWITHHFLGLSPPSFLTPFVQAFAVDNRNMVVVIKCSRRL